MPDRSLRLHAVLPPSVPGRGGILWREGRPPTPAPSRESQEGSSGEGSSGEGSPSDGSGDGRPSSDDNPFAPPPAGTPDSPWQPRRHSGEGRNGGEDEGGSPWGSQWSDRQPGRSQGGGFGERPGQGNGGGGPEGQSGPNLRWDPTDPAQRRARYALLSGMWAFFFALFNWPYVALLLGALAVYWGSSALRAKSRTPDPSAPPSDTKPQRTAAVSGLVTASLALFLVVATFTAQLVYRDYYTCVNDSLTHVSKQSCEQYLPKELRGVLGTEG